MNLPYFLGSLYWKYIIQLWAIAMRTKIMYSLIKITPLILFHVEEKETMKCLLKVDIQGDNCIVNSALWNAKEESCLFLTKIPSVNRNGFGDIFHLRTPPKGPSRLLWEPMLCALPVTVETLMICWGCVILSLWAHLTYLWHGHL